MSDAKKSTSIITPEFRASYPSVFQARHNKLSKKDEYSVTALFPLGADLSKLKAAAKAACVKKWGADETLWPKNLRTPFRDQSERAVVKDGKSILPDGYTAGAIFLNLKSTTRPAVVDQQVQVIIDPSQFYAGCYAIASVSCYAYDQAGNRGVSFGLTNIQKTRDGEPFSGRSTPEADFSPVDTGTKTTESLFN